MKKYLRAGAIAREARELGVSKAAPGMSSLKLADAIESLIRDRGGQCAFPVNIGVNEVAAHYTPARGDDVVLRQGDVVKIDVGAHVDGYPADTAATVEVGTSNHTALIESARAALEMCVEMVSPGTTLSAMGAAVSRTIRSAGFKPIQNLTGHSMDRFNLHAGLSIPSVETRDHTPLKEGDVLAIEPFSSTGSGKVNGRERGNIYRIVRERKAPPEVAALFTKMRASFGPFPFAGRWCDPLDGNAPALVHKMYRLGMIMNYPVLCDTDGSAVAQAEHSVIVTSSGCRVIT